MYNSIIQCGEAPLPLSPLHYPIAYAAYKLKNNLSLPGFIVGSMFPDFEIPVIRLFFTDKYIYDRLVLHSLLGAATIGTVLSILFTVFLYPIQMIVLFRVKRELVRSEKSLSINLVISCFLGTMSHVLLDITTHPYNPVFWPFQTTTASPIYTSLSSLLIHIILALICLVLLAVHRRNPWEELLIS